MTEDQSYNSQKMVQKWRDEEHDVEEKDDCSTKVTGAKLENDV